MRLKATYEHRLQHQYCRFDVVPKNWYNKQLWKKNQDILILGDEDIKMNTENMYENFNSMNELHTIATVQLVLKVNYW